MSKTEIFTEDNGVHTKKNPMEIFKNEEFGEIRTVDINGKPYFVGNDVAKALEYVRPYEAVSAHCRGAVSYRVLTNGGEQETKIITEGDVYRLIVKAADQSKSLNIKEKAGRFEVWVFDEVLPSIRKNGIYATDNVIDSILNNPDFGIELLTKLKEERQARFKAEQRNAILMHVNKTYTMTEIAKELGLKSAVELNKKLSELHIQYKVNNTWVMYSDYSNLGYEEIKQEVLDNGAVVYHRRITQSGREFILNLISSNAN